MNIGGAVIFDETYQSKESFFKGKPLDVRNFEHICPPLGAYLQNLRFDFLRELIYIPKTVQFEKTYGTEVPKRWTNKKVKNSKHWTH